MESYRGIAILTTNMKQALDTAFLRRLRFIVQFSFPDASQRERIWQRVFPTRTPVAALDYKRLAQLNIPGGIIRNIATYSAFLAAEEGRAVHMDHILRASRMEYAKIDKPLTATETGGWL
jgi:SpoVK/Ycf46/Vps4 family AAA+-type ATPase